MLNKEICKLCINQTSKIVKHWKPWHEEDEYQWKSGSVYCRIILNSGNILTDTVFIKREPPFYCKYKMEHIISEC